VIWLSTKHPDPLLKQIVKALEEYALAHPRAKIEVYRQNSVSVRTRIIDPSNQGTEQAAAREGNLGDSGPPTGRHRG
jgi:hypothetical protein